MFRVRYKNPTKRAYVTHQQGSWKWQKRHALVEYKPKQLKSGKWVWARARVLDNKVKPKDVEGTVGSLQNVPLTPQELYVLAQEMGVEQNPHQSLSTLPRNKWVPARIRTTLRGKLHTGKVMVTSKGVVKAKLPASVVRKMNPGKLRIKRGENNTWNIWQGRLLLSGPFYKKEDAEWGLNDIKTHQMSGEYQERIAEQKVSSWRKRRRN